MKNSRISVILSEAKNLKILRSLCSLRITSLFIFNILFLVFNFSIAHAGVCIWRFPDKDIQTLFPKATGYKTEVLTFSKSEKVRIESLLGAKLDDDETQFN